MRPLLVGEVNPHSADPRLALFLSPRGCAGDRLRRHLGLTRTEYLLRFDRVNLCQSRWSLREAAESARKLEDRPKMILLGSKVCAAFGVPYRPFRIARGCWNTVAVLPHPSGRCRAWNDPRAGRRARRVVEKFVGSSR